MNRRAVFSVGLTQHGSIWLVRDSYQGRAKGPVRAGAVLLITEVSGERVHDGGLRGGGQAKAHKATAGKDSNLRDQRNRGAETYGGNDGNIQKDGGRKFIMIAIII